MLGLRFVREVLETPCTWKGLCDCISRTPGLPESLAKDIETSFVNKYATELIKRK